MKRRLQVGIGIWCTCVCEGGRLPLVLLPPLLPPPVKRGHKPVFNIIAGDSKATAARVRCLSPRLTSRNRTFQVPLNPIAVATAAGRQGDAPRSAVATHTSYHSRVAIHPTFHPPPLPPYLASHNETPE